MLYRKTKQNILEWIKNGRKALLVDGARQVGKTFLIENCLEESGRPYRKIDLIQDKKANRSLSVASEEGLDSILEALSFYAPDSDKEDKPIIFLDEVQECPELITMIKYLVQEGRYRYILSGSLLGIALTHVRSVPVGFMETLTMYPLDFEEFAINSGWNKTSIKAIETAFENETPINEYLHEKTFALFKRYLLVGGMPDAVNEYISSKDIRKTVKVLDQIRELYKADFSKRKEGNPLILELIYDRIPRRLREQNHRFVVGDIKDGARTDDFEDDFYWLYKAGAIIPVYNAASPALPMEISTSQKLVKLFYNDVGLLTSSYGLSFAESYLNGEDANLGGIYENYVAQALLTSSFTATPPMYFKARKIGEIDFLSSLNAETVAIEVKSGKYRYSHPSLTKMMEIENYGLKKAFVLCNGNVEKMDKVTYLPIYMAGLIS